MSDPNTPFAGLSKQSEPADATPRANTATTEISDWLQAYLAAHQGVAGTVHVVVGDCLELKAHINIPPPVVQVTQTIPIGKGMAGLAWQRDQPVQTCNLKEDASGDVRPGARAVEASAAVALPVHVASATKGGASGGSSERVRAVVGIAFADSGEIAPKILSDLHSAAEQLPH